MAGSSSGKAAYWTGALSGLICSVALVAVLSVLDDRRSQTVGSASSDTSSPAQTSGEGGSATATSPTETQAASPTETATASSPDPVPSPDPAPESAPNTNDEVEQPRQTAAVPTPAPAPEPAPQQSATPAPSPAPDPEVEEDALPAQAADGDAPVPSAQGALVEHSEFFNGDPDEPVLAIVLVGVGAGSGTTDEVFLLPAPLTLSIDPALETAPNLVIDARDSGFEALATLDAPLSGAEAQAASEMAGRLARLPGVIGVAAVGDALNGNAAINGVLTAIAPRGMALFDATAEGGSTGFRTARGMGLPAAPLGRAFDETPSSAMVFQSLERAAFDARRTGAFIVIGEATPAVLTGLRRWLNVKAGKSVAVAPLSEVFRRLKNQ